MTLTAEARPTTLAELLETGWNSKSVKQEIHDNFLAKLQAGEELYPGIIGYDDTVLPELNIALLAQHDLLFLGEKGQAKSRLMRLLVNFLDDAIPYLADPAIPVHDDPLQPITRRGKELVPIARPKTCPSPGGRVKIVTRSDSRPAPSLPTSSAKSIRRSSPPG